MGEPADEFDLLLEAEDEEDECGFLMYANDAGYSVGQTFFNAHVDLYAACHVVHRNERTGWNTVRFATKEPPTNETIGNIAAQIIGSGAAVRVGCVFGGHAYRPVAA